jgi:hypothetical protein
MEEEMTFEMSAAKTTTEQRFAGPFDVASGRQIISANELEIGTRVVSRNVGTNAASPREEGY